MILFLSSKNKFFFVRYLHKLGATFHGWSKRWFVLDRQKMALIYYSDKSERKPRGGAYFSVSLTIFMTIKTIRSKKKKKCKLKTLI